MEALQEIRSLARQYAVERVRPHVERWDRDGAFDDDVLGQLAELGFPGMLVPEATGGMGLDLASFAAAVEELAWGDASVALTVVLHSAVAVAVAASGDTALAEGLAEGESIATMAITGEEGVQNAAGERISATVRWVANGGRATVLALVADGSIRTVGLKGAGVRVGGPEETLGLRPLQLRTIELSEAEAGDALPLEGAAQALRAGVAATAVGIAQAALEHARDYAAQREQFGRALREFEGMQHKLADMAMRVWASRALLGRAVADGEESLLRAAKVFASEGAMAVTTQAVQVFGGYGYMRDYPVEKLMRDAKATELMAQLNGRHRVRIARGLYEG